MRENAAGATAVEVEDGVADAVEKDKDAAGPTAVDAEDGAADAVEKDQDAAFGCEVSCESNVGLELVTKGPTEGKHE